MPPLLPPTSPDLEEALTRPYFLWWTDATVDDLRRALQNTDAGRRAYWLGALLREANTRDVWLFVTPAEIRAAWPRVRRHLGRTRSMWAYLLGIEDADDARAARRGRASCVSRPVARRLRARSATPRWRAGS